MIFVILLLLPFAFADIDYALECDKGYRVSGIRRTKTHYSTLGSLTIECEQVSRAEVTTCVNQPTIPKCSGSLEGCTGNTWLGGVHAFLLENATQAVVLDPICCTSPSVRIDSDSCIHDQINMATKDFSHSLVSDLIYRGIQCWHQYDSNETLVDLLWKTEICPYVSDDFPVLTTETACEDCVCHCGIQQCSDGKEPVRVVHKKRIGRCGCDCRCTFQCVTFA